MVFKIFEWIQLLDAILLANIEGIFKFLTSSILILRKEIYPYTDRNQ